MERSQASRRKTDYEEYEVENVADSLTASLGERLAKYVKEFSIKRSLLRLSASSADLLPRGKYYINPQDKKYQVWWLFMVIVALYSSMFTPLEFGFFRGLSQSLWIVDLSVQLIFFADIVIRFFTAYTDPETYRLVGDHRKIALRYIKSDFVLDLLGCLPWDTIYKNLGRKEEVRFLVWVRLYRVQKVDSFFVMLEKDIRINYFAARIAKLLAVEFYCTHTAACIFYYLATTVKASDESYTWIGSLTLGSFSYQDFRAINLGKRYITSLYWAVLTMATVAHKRGVNECFQWFFCKKKMFRLFIRELEIRPRRRSTRINDETKTITEEARENERSCWINCCRRWCFCYGDIHAVNVREMIFVMIFVSFDMILGAYLIGNMTAIIVKGSSTEKFREKMTCLIKYMNRNRLPRNIRNQMKSHMRLQFESGTMRDGDGVLEDFPSSVRAKIANSLYSELVEEVSIFKHCSAEFRNEIVRFSAQLMAMDPKVQVLVFFSQVPQVTRVTEEYFLPGEIVISQGGASDQFYIVYDGVLEEIIVHENGNEERIDLLENAHVFGEVGVLCNIPQPFTVRVVELCRVLRLDKHSFTDIVEIYFNDGRLVIQNLLECKDTDARVGQLASDVTLLMAKHEAEMALMVNDASYRGDLVQLKHLLKEGAVAIMCDYDGRTPLHLAASKGFEPVLLYLIREGANVNAIDKFGVSPLLEAIKGGHDNCLSLLMDKGAELHLQDEAAYLCKAVKSGNSELLRRLLVAGVDVSASDYDNRTALHLAAAEGCLGMAKMLIEAGANIFAQDRWGRTPLDEAMLHQHAPLTALLEDTVQKDQGALSEELKETNPGPRSRKLKYALKGNGDYSPARLDGEEKSRVQGYGSISPQSTESISPSSNRGHSNGQSSSERRLSLSLGLDSPSRTNVMDLEILPHRYRKMSYRQVGQHPHSQQPSVFERNRRRVTIFPYHPWTSGRAGALGKVEWVPPTVEDVLNLAYKHFGKLGSKVLNQDAGEISSTDLMMDSEKIYVVDDHDILGRGSCP